MPLLVGLGNVGEKYDGTRHNVGFELADSLAEGLSASFSKGRGPYLEATGRHKGRNVVIIKPTTFMNLSGKAVRKAQSHHNMDVADTLICYDDLNLDLGTIRLRPGGSHGGHNGIENIIQSLGTRNFPRLRLGIGNDYPRGRQVEFVLSPFSRQEREEVDRMIEEAEDAALCFVREGLDMAMNRFN